MDADGASVSLPPVLLELLLEEEELLDEEIPDELLLELLEVVPELELPFDEVLEELLVLELLFEEVLPDELLVLVLELLDDEVAPESAFEPPPPQAERLKSSSGNSML